MGEITRLDEDLSLPLPNDLGSELYEYARVLVGELSKIIGEETNTTVNLLLDQGGNTTIVYFGLPDGEGVYPNGTWRINATSSSEYLIQL